MNTESIDFFIHVPKACRYVVYVLYLKIGALTRSYRFVEPGELIINHNTMYSRRKHVRLFMKLPTTATAAAASCN